MTLEVRSKGQISLNLDYHVNSKIFIPIFVCVLTNKILKTYWTEFWLCCWGHDPGVGLGGAGWIKNFSLGICDGTPSTVHSSSNVFSMYLFLRYWAKRKGEVNKWPYLRYKFTKKWQITIPTYILLISMDIQNLVKFYQSERKMNSRWNSDSSQWT